MEDMEDDDNNWKSVLSPIGGFLPKEDRTLVISMNNDLILSPQNRSFLSLV
jgi:hypothetical protein